MEIDRCHTTSTRFIFKGAARTRGITEQGSLGLQAGYVFGLGEGRVLRCTKRVNNGTQMCR